MEKKSDFAPDITVVVCTYNRSEILEMCLSSLSVQDADYRVFEVVIVDNNSTDGTGDVIRKYTRKYGNFRGVIEMKQGISHARNRGFREARGEYVAYIDDDAKADSRWIAVMIDFIRRHPNVAAFGGPCYDYALIGFPDWYPPECRKLELEVSEDLERPLRIPKETFGGANMVIRKDLLRECGGFDIHVGHQGRAMSYGEDTEILIRLNLNGYEIFYVHSLKVNHLIVGYKLNLPWLLRSQYQKGRSIDYILHRQIGILEHAARLVGSLILGFMAFFKPVPMPFKRRIYYACRYTAYQAGATVSSWKR